MFIEILLINFGILFFTYLLGKQIGDNIALEMTANDSNAVAETRFNALLQLANTQADNGNYAKARSHFAAALRTLLELNLQSQGRSLNVIERFQKAESLANDIGYTNGDKATQELLTLYSNLLEHSTKHLSKKHAFTKHLRQQCKQLLALVNSHKEPTLWQVMWGRPT